MHLERNHLGSSGNWLVLTETQRAAAQEVHHYLVCRPESYDLNQNLSLIYIGVRNWTGGCVPIASTFQTSVGMVA